MVDGPLQIGSTPDGMLLSLAGISLLGLPVFFAVEVIAVPVEQVVESS
jgi:hypothetical protein